MLHRARFRPYRRATSAMSTAMLVGLVAVVALVGITRVGGGVNALFSRTGNTLSTVTNGGTSGGGNSGGSGPTGGPYSSCQQSKTDNPGQTGVAAQQITINGTPRSIICDMTSYGGGWTLVAAQFDSDPVSWNQGITNHAYTPALNTKTSFALSSAEIPSHSQIAFGRIEGNGVSYTTHMIDAVTGTYQTGNYQPAVSMTSINSATQYWVHRNSGGFYNCHEVDGACSNGTQNGAGANSWGNTLSFDIRNGNSYADWNWAFSPEFSSVTYRSFSYQGDLQGSTDSFAWAVWVR